MMQILNGSERDGGGSRQVTNPEAANIANDPDFVLC